MTFHLSMSPLTPNEPQLRSNPSFNAPPMRSNTNAQPISNLTQAVARLDTAEVYNWTPQQVATWMYNAGFEQSVVEKFESNDISGAILVDLKFEDLKELDIPSFGKRHRLWTEIHHLRGSPESSASDSSRPRSHESGGSLRRRHTECNTPEEEAHTPTRRHRSRRHHKRHADDTIISPAESVSIVGIEQLLPKPHRCSKGERCAKYRKQQRQFARLAQEHPISPEGGGAILITGNPGNASTAEAMFRPTSDAIPSVVASSDVLGPGQHPDFKLGEETLKEIQARDPQDNVKQFLNFQHMPPSFPSEEPATPPLEMFPSLQAPSTRQDIHENLRSLPKLTIPPTRAASVSHAKQRSASAFSPERTMAQSHAYRHGTPFSEMDVPVTSIPTAPVARDFSQSVPPDMQYRRDSIPMNRMRMDSRRPSFGMAKLPESAVLETIDGPEEVMAGGKDVNHAGWMKKRKTKFLRHEWNEHYCVLKGTKLAMQQHQRSIDELEHIDVDDYAVACSTIASNKLSAALKSMKLAGKKEGENTPYAFQLVPSAERKGIKHAAVGKTHHFAVNSRDQRIDWMRELMLAKAIKAKGEGYEINVNGNMI